jgi:hypothetical protein
MTVLLTQGAVRAYLMRTGRTDHCTNFATVSKLLDIGATKRICSDCELAIKPTGANISTPLKGAPNKKNAMARAGAGGVTRAVAGLNVYLTLRDAAQAAGIAQPDYVQIDAPYYFTAQDGSVFTIKMPGWFGSYKRNYVAGPRAGQTETITDFQFEVHKKVAEVTWGKYIPGGLFREPRFIPGTKRKSLPLTDERGNEIGYIDEEGVHQYPSYMINKGT